jgi:hypothetical protein
VSTIFTRSFAVATGERALKAFCSTLLAFIPAVGIGAVPSLNWGDMLTLSGYAALGSVLLSVVSSGVGGTGPSIANEVISPPAVDPGEGGHSTVEVVLIAALVCVVVIVGWQLVT